MLFQKSLRKLTLAAAIAAPALLTACGGPADGLADGQEEISAGDDVALEETDDAIIAAPSTFALLDPCRTAAPDAVRTLNVGSVEAQSWGTGYSTRSCPRFVLDVSVPANSTPARYYPDFRLYGTAVSLPTTQAACEAHRTYVRVYKKAAGTTSFAVQTSATLIGKWIPAGPLFGAHCEESLYSGELHPVAVPPASGTDVYRIATSAKNVSTNVFKTVKSGAWHMPIIY